MEVIDKNFNHDNVIAQLKKEGIIDKDEVKRIIDEITEQLPKK